MQSNDSATVTDKKQQDDQADKSRRSHASTHTNVAPTADIKCAPTIAPLPPGPRRLSADEVSALKTRLNAPTTPLANCARSDWLRIDEQEQRVVCEACSTYANSKTGIADPDEGLRFNVAIVRAVERHSINRNHIIHTLKYYQQMLTLSPRTWHLLCMQFMCLWFAADEFVHYAQSLGVEIAPELLSSVTSPTSHEQSATPIIGARSRGSVAKVDPDCRLSFTQQLPVADSPLLRVYNDGRHRDDDTSPATRLPVIHPGDGTMTCPHCSKKGFRNQQSIAGHIAHCKNGKRKQAHASPKNLMHRFKNPSAGELGVIPTASSNAMSTDRDNDTSPSKKRRRTGTKSPSKTPIKTDTPITVQRSPKIAGVGSDKRESQKQKTKESGAAECLGVVDVVPTAVKSSVTTAHTDMPPPPVTRRSAVGKVAASSAKAKRRRHSSDDDGEQRAASVASSIDGALLLCVLMMYTLCRVIIHRQSHRITNTRRRQPPARNTFIKSRFINAERCWRMSAASIVRCHNRNDRIVVVKSSRVAGA
jgi:hypothetical protein